MRIAPKSIPSATNSKWWLFCLAIVVLKFLLLALDPLPKLYLGDSISYIWTAIFGWIPEDRSFFYGYVSGCSALLKKKLTSLLIVQVYLGVIIAIIVELICKTMFDRTYRRAIRNRRH